MAIPALLEFGIGVVAVVLGLLWIAYPARMMDLQTKITYLGRIEPGEHTDRERTYGRVGGVLLAVAGGALATGLL